MVEKPTVTLVRTITDNITELVITREDNIGRSLSSAKLKPEALKKFRDVINTRLRELGVE